MLHRIIGAAGSGKTEYMLKCVGEALKKGSQCYIIVPEQQSVDYESVICERFGDSSNLLCEVLNFERLPNRIARDFGGLVVNNIDKGGTCALLSVIADELKPQLKEFSAIASDPDFAQSLYTLISRMKMAMVTPAMISGASKNDTLDDNRLVSKLADISLIYSEYESYFSDELCDPRDALTRLAKELSAKPFFKNTCVFIDSYYTFTEQEYAIIKEIIAQSKDTYISFTVDSTRSFFRENENAAKRVKSLSSCGCEDYVLPEPRRFSSESLKFIERNLFKNQPGAIDADDGSVRFITAKNRFDEVEAAASEILEYIRAGGRFRDITVLAGDTETYQPIIDSVFSRADIPIYLSSKESLETKSLFSFVIAGLLVVIEDFSLPAMKRYIKSGYSGLTVKESDALLSYASSWKLRGKAWYGDEDWTLDPEGYREGEMSARSVEVLAIANNARRKIVNSLSALRDNLYQKDLTVSKGLRAIYSHLMDMEADERLRRQAERALNNGQREKSERLIQLWKILINIIDQLDSVCGERPVTPKRLLELFRLMCGCYSLGAIPVSADSVTFGSASLIRAGNSKMVLVLGVCDGEFPQNSHTSGFFDRIEATKLEGAGLQLADTLEKQLNTNRFFVYAALSAPKDRLVLLCPKSELAGEEKRPSMAWLSVKNMLPNIKEIEFSEEDMLYSRESIATYFSSIESGNLKNNIAEALNGTKTLYFDALPSVIQPDSHIDFKDDQLKLSPSAFEKYILCPFSYFNSYILGLKEKKINEYDVSQIGNSAHKLLEEFMKRCVSTGKFISPDEHTRNDMINEIANKYLLEIIGNGAINDKRFMHTFTNMVKTVAFVAESLCEEFSESKFTPSGFEYKIDMKENSDIPAIEYDVDGKQVLLRGSIDRVDTYTKDGVTYARVIDYKTYDKPFSLNLVAHGMDTQLLHYLFAYCDKNKAKPAGALYYTVKLPSVTITGRETTDDIRGMIAKSILRDGVLLNEEDIVLAMSPDCRFVPARLKNGGGFWKNKRLISEDDFNELSAQLNGQVENLARNIFNGNMNIAPNDCDGKKEPCKYCRFGDICRMKNTKEEIEDDGNKDSDTQSTD